MGESTAATPVPTRSIGDTTIIYAGDYLNKLSGERLERACKHEFDGGRRALVISFRETELVNSIGVSILMGVIAAAEQSQARVIFSDVNPNTAELFQMLGVTKHVSLAADEGEALALLGQQAEAAGSSAA